MSTRIGIISEGPIDHVLLPPLISQIAEQRVGIRWPVNADDVGEVLRIRKTGHGGVLVKLQALVEFLEEEPLDYALFVIVLDHKTHDVQREIRRLISGKDRFVLGIAIEEMEAWWLGDRTNTLAWSGFSHDTLPECRYGQRDAKGKLTYAAEKDDNPKLTLHEVTEQSDRFDSVYGDGNTGLASGFAENYWKPNAQLIEIATQCPGGYGQFEQHLTDGLRPLLKPAKKKR